VDTQVPKFVKKVFIRSFGADPSPPLGTILGNIGVNTVNFCTAFNSYTSGLPNYFLLKTTIYIFPNNSFRFIVDLPSTGSLFSLLRFERTIRVKVHDRLNDKIILCTKLFSVVQVALLKFPNLTLSQSLPIIKGSLRSMNLTVVRI